MKEMEDKEKVEVESAPPREVLATVTGLDEDSDSEKTPHRVRTRDTPELRPGRGLDFGEGCPWRNSQG
jgi:hypothetical protein